MERYRESLDWYEEARKYSPGAAQTLSKMGVRFPLGAFPISSHGGLGARIKSVDGDWFVDWIGALGACPLGYGHQAVSKAVHEQIEFGSALSLPYAGELSLAKKLCERIPCAESVRFVSSGSESTEAAIRTARIWKQVQTGREDTIGAILVVGSGYNSWHSWFQSIKPFHPGIPWPYRTMIDSFNYNDLPSLEEAFDNDLIDAVAAVILEPCLFEKPNDGFLQGVRDLCTKNRALLIFDEMVTGYRWALAGGQEYFGITPDLATFGKGMANGLPIGMLCGKREYMQHAELISGTFGGNAVSLAAANAVLDVYEQEPVIETMWKRGKELQDGFNVKAGVILVHAVCDGYACKPRFKFTYDDAEINAKAMSLFLQVSAEYGALFHPGGLNVCAALTDDDMAITQRAVTRGLNAVEYAVRNDDWSELKGEIIKPVVTVRQ